MALLSLVWSYLYSSLLGLVDSGTEVPPIPSYFATPHPTPPLGLWFRSLSNGSQPQESEWGLFCLSNELQVPRVRVQEM
jgi:hypothetical protein